MKSGTAIQNTLPVISETTPRDSKWKTVKRVRKYFREYCEYTGIHGLRYIAEKRSLSERLLWGFLVLSSVVACYYVINRIYVKYDQSPVIVSFATKESPIFTVPFPAVTICPMSKTRRTKLNYTRAIHMLQENGTLSSDEEYRKAHYLSFVCEEGEYLFEENKTFSDEFFETLDELKVPMIAVLPCVFMGYEEECYKLFKYIILDQGICFTFNMLDRDEIFKENVVHYSDYHKNENISTWNIDEGYSKDSKVDAFPRRALLSGADNGLQIILLQFTSDIDHLCVEDVQGYSVVLHTPHTIPRPNKQYFQLPFDTSVLAAVQPKMMTTSEEVKNYDPQDRECYIANERPLKFFKIYTPENCRMECLTNYTLKQCGCVDYFMPRDNKTSICGNGNLECMDRAERQLKVIELNTNINREEKVKNDESCDCMPLCSELSYYIEQSQTEWEWYEQLRALKFKDYEKMKQTVKVAKLSVFFKEEQFLTSQRNELYGPIDFLANFGGLLGLFTGFSLLSLMEIIYFLTIRIFCNLRQHKVWYE